jgi:leucyl-tRNA synthetase
MAVKSSETQTYDPGVVEEKWRTRWAERRTNAADLRGAERPHYNLMMYPYPSAEGLHVGNVFAFVGADMYGRSRSASTRRTMRSRSNSTRRS